MTEQQWLCCTDPAKMLDFLRASGRASERKFRLFACACCRRIWESLGEEVDRRAVEVAEQYADGFTGQKELQQARQRVPRAGVRRVAWAAARPSAYGAAKEAAPHSGWFANARPVTLGGYTGWEVVGDLAGERAMQSGLLRDIFGPLPFRPLPPIALQVLAWNDGCVVNLATSIYEERAFSQERVGVLADALEEAGVTDEEVLGHLRGSGPHCRGCWVVDSLTGRE
jgi:hypothetical protein